MNKLYSISECANFCGISTRTLRYYNALGIIVPRIKDEKTNYRYYGAEEIDRIHFVQIMKEMGFSLERIKSEMDNMDSKRFLGIISERRQWLERESVRINNQLKKARLLERNLIKAINFPIGNIFIEELPERAGLFVQLPSQDKFENLTFRHHLERKYNISTLPGNVRRVISAENLKRGEFIEYTGYFIGEEDIPEGTPDITVMPASLAVTCYCPVERSQSGPYWESLVNFIAANGYEIAGNGLKTVLIEKGVAADPDEYLSRLSIPIKKSE